ncbi:MAG: purple acid phosphatase family protein [Candidatus Binatia bacterium]
MTSATRRGQGISRRRFLRTTAAGAGALVAAPVFWRRPGRAAVPPSGLHLAYGTDPTREMTISWLTREEVASPALRFGPDPGSYGAAQVAITRTVKADLPIYQDSTSFYHHVRLSGLAPGTKYSYRVEHAGGASGDLEFETAPGAPVSFTFTAFGDQGVSAAAASTTARIAAIAAESGTNHAFQFHVGDICYAHTVIGAGIGGPTNQAVWDDWFEQVSPVASLRPWMTTVGNHEMEPGYGSDLGYGGYVARFHLPKNGADGAPVTYSFVHGNVGFIVLDANDASYEIPHNQCYAKVAQDEWLRATLEAYRADASIDFVVVGFHHCAYCTNLVHASDGGVRDRWGALFDEFGVDLVINGHNHCYERTHPIRAGAKTTEVGVGGTVRPVLDGTTYVTAGGGGSQPYPVALYPASYVTTVGGVRVPESADWSALRELKVSLLRADVMPPAAPGGATTMRLCGVLPDGTLIDELTLERTQGERYEPAGPAAGSALPYVCAPAG